MRQVVRRAVTSAQRTSRDFLQRRAIQPPQWLARRWERNLWSLLKHGRASVGNTVAHYADGDDAMEAIWAAIAAAKRRVWMEMYLLEDDRVGTRTLDELTQAAQRGCDVTVLLDGLGSSNLPAAALLPLRQAGPGMVEIAIFNPIRLWRWPVRRDHRKIIIVDGRIGFCGGMNISEDYAGKCHGNGRFHDSIMRMQGPCVRDLAAVFASSWKALTHGRKPLPRRSKTVGESFVQVLESHGAVGRRSIQRAMRLSIRNAATHCYITTPYFIPPLRVVRSIRQAADRGVDVRILTAGLSDVPFVRLAAQHIYGSLLRHKVRIFEMVHSTLHAKTVTVDGVYSSVGSFNLDTWSDKRNLEANVAVIDPNIACEMQDLFLRNIETSHEVTLENWHTRPWWLRTIHWLAYHVLRL